LHPVCLNAVAADPSLFLADRSAADHSVDNSGSVAMQEARIELLQRMPVFGGIRADVLEFLLGLCPVVSVPTNAFFFREHDQADSMFVLEAGKVAVLKSWHGREYLLRTLKEGDCFGEMAVMDLSPRSASVRAVEDCTAICLSAANLYKVYAQDLKQFALIQMNMGREVCRRLREADNRLFRARMGTPGADSKHVFLAG
jgi:CRP/FNR family cyclic AMP-dependent transcriptional regulator